MHKKDYIFIPNSYIDINRRYNLSVKECVELLDCLFDDVEPSGKSSQFMEAFKYLRAESMRAEAIYNGEIEEDA
jgi:hypothetical protein